MAVLQNYEGSDNDYVNVGVSQDIGQGFQLQADANVTHVSIKGGKGTVGTQPGTMKIELLSGSYAGSVIATVSSFATTVMSDWTPTPAWYEFAFDVPVDLIANTNYWIKASGLTGSANDVFRWSSDNTTPSYTLGSTWYNGSAITGNDQNFRISGTEAGGSITKSNLMMMGLGT